MSRERARKNVSYQQNHVRRAGAEEPLHKVGRSSHCTEISNMSGIENKEKKSGERARKSREHTSNRSAHSTDYTDHFKHARNRQQQQTSQEGGRDGTVSNEQKAEDNHGRSTQILNAPAGHGSSIRSNGRGSTVVFYNRVKIGKRQESLAATVLTRIRAGRDTVYTHARA